VAIRLLGRGTSSSGRTTGFADPFPARAAVNLEPPGADLPDVRLSLATLVLLALGGVFVMHERKSALEGRLGSVATQLGARHVHVHCQSLAADLVDVTSEAGTVRFDASGVPADVTDLKRPVCKALERFPHDVRSPPYSCVLAGSECPRRIFEDVLAVHTLAHEVWHLHGVEDEAKAECDALQTTARAAELFGADPRAAQATAAYALARLYPSMPDEYREAGCTNGGPGDLRPADPIWP
jgi:hypothetical protein